MVRVVISCNKSYAIPVNKYYQKGHSEWVIMPGTMVCTSFENGECRCTHTSDMWISGGFRADTVTGQINVARTRAGLQIRPEHPMQYDIVEVMPPYAKSKSYTTTRTPPLSKRYANTWGADDTNIFRYVMAIDGERFEKNKKVGSKYFYTAHDLDHKFDVVFSDDAPRTMTVNALHNSKVLQSLVLQCEPNTGAPSETRWFSITINPRTFFGTLRIGAVRTQVELLECEHSSAATPRFTPRNYTPVLRQRTRRSTIPQTSLLTVNEKDTLESLYAKGTPVGKGGYGETRLVTLGNTECIVKNLKNRHDAEKEYQVHTAAFTRLVQASGGTPEYITEPLCQAGKYTLQTFAPKKHGGDIMTLGKYVAKYDFDKKRCVALGMQLAGILANLHKVSILHNDLSGDNLLVEDSKPPHLILVDFGVGTIRNNNVATNARRIHNQASYARHNSVPIMGMRSDIEHHYNVFEKNQFTRNVILLLSSNKAREKYWKLMHSSARPTISV